MAFCPSGSSIVVRGNDSALFGRAELSDLPETNAAVRIRAFGRVPVAFGDETVKATDADMKVGAGQTGAYVTEIFAVPAGATYISVFGNGTAEIEVTQGELLEYQAPDPEP